MSRIVPWLILFVCLTAASPARGLELFVATDGDDANAGSRERPFRTLERARDALRHHGELSMFLLRGESL